MLQAFLHARFGLLVAAQLLAVAGVVAGGLWMWVGISMFPIHCVMEEILGDDNSNPEYSYPALLDLILHLTLPLVVLHSVLFAYYLGDVDPLRLEVLAGALFDIDLAANRASTSAIDLVGGGMGVALYVGTGGVNVAHEFVHRHREPACKVGGLGLLAFTCDANWWIYHLSGHHTGVGLEDDVSTAKRGEYILAFIARSIWGTNAFGFRFEAARLRRRGLPWLHWSNRALRVQILPACVAAGYLWLAGWPGLVAYFAIAFAGKAFLEAVSYIEHYGLVRAPGEPIEARHAWDCYRFLTNAVLYNLPRHADHHLAGHQPFWRNVTQSQAPRMRLGYGVTIVAAFIPPLWRRLTDPVLADWDARLASPAERELVTARGLALAI
jgi:alkane 1-monooxygenase